MASFLSGCNLSSDPEIFHSPINLIEQTSMARIDSHKYQLNDFQHIDISTLNTIGFQGDFGKKYAINFKKVKPIDNGTVEIEFKFSLSQNNESDKEEKVTADNFAGIGFKIAENNDYFAAVLSPSGMYREIKI